MTEIMIVLLTFVIDTLSLQIIFFNKKASAMIHRLLFPYII